jgi:hypothetical protein
LPGGSDGALGSAGVPAAPGGADPPGRACGSPRRSTGYPAVAGPAGRQRTAAVRGAARPTRVRRRALGSGQASGCRTTSAARAQRTGNSLVVTKGLLQRTPAWMPPGCSPATSASAAGLAVPYQAYRPGMKISQPSRCRRMTAGTARSPHGRGSRGPQLLHDPGAGHRAFPSASPPGRGGPASARRPKARSRRSAGDRPNGIVGYQNCLGLQCCL